MSKKLSKILILSLGITICLYIISKTDFSFNIISTQELKSSISIINNLYKNFLQKYFIEIQIIYIN